MLNRIFKLNENQTTVKTEVLAGATTFFTIIYILAVNPEILSAAGIDKGAVFVATALASFTGTLVVAFRANYPFVLAPGMGLNAYFAYSVVNGMGFSWQLALLAVFTEGLIFLLLSMSNVREAIFNAIPTSLKIAAGGGIGLFITFIAFQSAKIVVDSSATLVTANRLSIGNLHGQELCTILTVLGTLITACLIAKKVKGALFLGILITWGMGIFCEVFGMYVPDASNHSLIPQFSLSSLSEMFCAFGSTFGAVFSPESWTLRGSDVSGFSLVSSFDFITVVFAFLFVDLFGAVSTLAGVSSAGGFLDANGRLPRIKGALYAESVATTAGAILGTSTTTTMVESASGIFVGGRTGLTALVCALLFLLAIPFAPIFLAVPGFATAPALILVGFSMAGSVIKINFKDPGESIPAFIAFITMPLTYSISDGIMLGVISYTFINVFTGYRNRVSVLMYILTILFIAKYILI